MLQSLPEHHQPAQNHQDGVLRRAAHTLYAPFHTLHRIYWSTPWHMADEYNCMTK